VRNYIREKIRAGKFLIRSLHQRQQTILNIGREIVKRQLEFLDKGVAYLKPLTMAQVAEVVGVHETTVSRGVSGKYMQTPQGIFEMKYFFTSGLPTDSGVGMSNTSVKEMIGDIFKNENTTQPLSDDAVADLTRFGGFMLEGMLEKAPILKLGMTEASRRPELWKRISPAPETALEMLSRYFERAARKGLIRRVNAKLAATVFFSFFFRSMVMETFLGRDVFMKMDRRAINDFCRLFVEGLGPAGRSPKKG
jgi:hypothetical protein